jgi:hypothetical protein
MFTAKIDKSYSDPETTSKKVKSKLFWTFAILTSDVLESVVTEILVFSLILSLSDAR